MSSKAERAGKIVATTAVALLLVTASIVFWPASVDDGRSDMAAEDFTEVVAESMTPTPVPTGTAPPTSTPMPTATAIPPQFAEMAALLAAGNDDETLAYFDTHQEVLDAQPRSAYPGLTEAMDEAYGDRLRAADRMVIDGDLAGAGAAVDQLLGWFPDNNDVQRRANAVAVWQQQEVDAVEWTGDVPHLFIHSLVIYPELAFDGDYQETGYQDYMITRVEFDRILEQMHAAGWMLVDIHDLFTVADDGTVTQTNLMIPPGRKPFVFSIDDVSYYDYMYGNGFAERLEIDEDFNVATVIYPPEGGELLTLDGDAMPILDQFVLDNPEFSHGGAKGILAVTGFDSAFGYDWSRDKRDAPGYDEQVRLGTEVADRLKELGWLFASHSYTHANELKDISMSYGRFVFDSDNWENEMVPVLGPTDIYISPFGFHLRDNDPRYRYLIEEKGFRTFNPISDGVTRVYNPDNMVMERQTVDGFVMRENPDHLEPYFDVDTVWDTARE